MLRTYHSDTPLRPDIVLSCSAVNFANVIKIQSRVRYLRGWLYLPTTGAQWLMTRTDRFAKKVKISSEKIQRTLSVFLCSLWYHFHSGAYASLFIVEYRDSWSGQEIGCRQFLIFYFVSNNLIVLKICIKSYQQNVIIIINIW